MQVKVGVAKETTYFYLHDRHLRAMLGSPYAGKSEGCHNKTSLLPAYHTPGMAPIQVKVMFLFENCNFTCINDIWCCSYAGKIDVFV